MHTHFHWYVKNSLAIQLYFKQFLILQKFRQMKVEVPADKRIPLSRDDIRLTKWR